MWVRLLIGALALLQVAAAPVVALVDGAETLDRSATAAHIEAHPAPECQAPHAADCGLCGFLAWNAATVHPANALACIVRRQSPALARIDLDAIVSAEHLPLSRAPPVL